MECEFDEIYRLKFLASSWRLARRYCHPQQHWWPLHDVHPCLLIEHPASAAGPQPDQVNLGAELGDFVSLQGGSHYCLSTCWPIEMEIKTTSFNDISKPTNYEFELGAGKKWAKHQGKKLICYFQNDIVIRLLFLC